MPAPKAPKPANPTTVASTQFGFNQQQQQANITANRPSQTTPFGNLDYTQTGVDSNGNPTWQLTSSLGPNIAPTVGNLTGAAGNISNALFSDPTYQGLPDFSEAAGTQVNANMDRYRHYSDPLRATARANLDNQLRNQGLMPGTTAYDNAIRTLEDNQARESDLALSGYQKNAFDQAVTQYGAPASMIANLFNTSFSADPASRFLNVPQQQMGATDFVGANTAYNTANQQAYAAKLAQYQAMLGGAASIGGTLLGAPPGSPGGNMMSSLFGGGGSTMAKT